MIVDNHREKRVDVINPSPAYEKGRQAFFDGFNPSDVAKFYDESSKDASDWIKGINDARVSSSSI